MHSDTFMYPIPRYPSTSHLDKAARSTWETFQVGSTLRSGHFSLWCLSWVVSALPSSASLSIQSSTTFAFPRTLPALLHSSSSTPLSPSLSLLCSQTSPPPACSFLLLCFPKHNEASHVTPCNYRTLATRNCYCQAPRAALWKASELCPPPRHPFDTPTSIIFDQDGGP